MTHLPLSITIINKNSPLRNDYHPVTVFSFTLFTLQNQYMLFELIFNITIMMTLFILHNR